MAVTCLLGCLFVWLHLCNLLSSTLALPFLQASSIADPILLSSLPPAEVGDLNVTDVGEEGDIVKPSEDYLQMVEEHDRRMHARTGETITLTLIT